MNFGLLVFLSHTELVTIECLLRSYEVKTERAAIYDLGFADDENEIEKPSSVETSVQSASSVDQSSSSSTSSASVGSKRKEPSSSAIANTKPYQTPGKPTTICVAQQLARGHTGFLTFATYWGKSASSDASDDETLSSSSSSSSPANASTPLSLQKLTHDFCDRF
jgi:hypothetical protein